MSHNISLLNKSGFGIYSDCETRLYDFAQVLYYEILDEELDQACVYGTQSQGLRQKFVAASKICECIFGEQTTVTVELLDDKWRTVRVAHVLPEQDYSVILRDAREVLHCGVQAAVRNWWEPRYSPAKIEASHCKTVS